MPFGIWAGDGVDGITIANLTIRDFYFHPIIFNAGAENPHVYNVHLIDAGEQFIKVNPDGLGGGVDNGIVEYSVIEFTTTGRSDYPEGRGHPDGAGTGSSGTTCFATSLPPSRLALRSRRCWRGAARRNTTVEGNTFVNCTRGVMLGADDYYSPSHARRRHPQQHRFPVRPARRETSAIMVTDSPDTQVLNNTVYLSGTYPSPIEYRYAGTATC